MISKIDTGGANTEPQEAAGRAQETRPFPREPQGDRVEIAHRDLAELSLPPSLQEALQRVLRSAPGAADAVTDLMDTAQTPDALDVVDGALNLNGGGAATLLGRLQELSREEAARALKALADLLKHGVVGYEYRWVNGEPHKVFIDAAIGSNLHRAPLVRGEGFDGLF